MSIAEHVSGKMAQFGLFSDRIEHELLQPTGIEIGQAFVDADGQNLPGGERLVAFDIAEMLKVYAQPQRLMVLSCL